MFFFLFGLFIYEGERQEGASVCPSSSSSSRSFDPFPFPPRGGKGSLPRVYIQCQQSACCSGFFSLRFAPSSRFSFPAPRFPFDYQVASRGFRTFPVFLRPCKEGSRNCCGFCMCTSVIPSLILLRRRFLRSANAVSQKRAKPRLSCLGSDPF